MWTGTITAEKFVTLMDSKDKLGGVGKTVQIDESKFGKRKYHSRHRVEGQWVFGGIEDDTGETAF